MKIIVSTIEELESALALEEDCEVVVSPGDYEWDGRTKDFSGVQNKQIRGSESGPVRFIGETTFTDGSDLLFDNILFRAPVDGATNLGSYDCFTLVSCQDVDVVRCSMIGGTDETFSAKAARNVRVMDCFLGGCFMADGHSHAMLVECDNFLLARSVLTACYRRLPQIGEYVDEQSLSSVLFNRIACGNTMSTGVKSFIGQRVQVVGNHYHRTRKTKPETAEVMAPNTPTGLSRVFFEQNIVTGGSEAMINLLTNEDFIERVAHPFDGLPLMKGWGTPATSEPGPLYKDSWHTFLLSHYGNGKVWNSEQDAGFPAL